MSQRFFQIGLFLILASLCGCGPPTLHSAAAADNDGQVLTLLKQGQNVNEKDGLGYTPLHWTAYYGAVKAAKVLVANGADIEAIEGRGMTPLTLGCYNATTPVVAFLLESKANPNAIDGIGWTPLCYAASNGDIAVATLLINAGAEVNPSRREAVRPLSVARGREMADFLRLHGAT